MIHVLPGITPDRLWTKNSSITGNSDHCPCEAGKKGARHPEGASIQRWSFSRIADIASNFCSLFPTARARKWTLAGVSDFFAFDREAITMQTGCLTPWKMRVFTFGRRPSGEQSMTQMSSQVRRK
jgi:hypothetical protein